MNSNDAMNIRHAINTCGFALDWMSLRMTFAQFADKIESIYDSPQTEAMVESLRQYPDMTIKRVYAGGQWRVE